jgi:hypothetical protein
METIVKKRKRATLRPEVIEYIKSKRGFIAQLVRLERRYGSFTTNASVISNRLKNKSYSPTMDFLVNIMEVGAQFTDFTFENERSLCRINRRKSSYSLKES